MYKPPRPAGAFPPTESEWWEAWRKEDYSWDGLARKPLLGWLADDEGKLNQESGRPATLQDFWRGSSLIWERRGAGGLPIRQWVAAHLPLMFNDGAPAKLAWSEREWQECEAELADRLMSLPSLDAPTFLDGLVLREPDHVPRPEVSYSRTAFVGRATKPLNCEKLSVFSCLFAAGADLENSCIGRASFDWTYFRSGPWLHKAVFDQEARFVSCRFGGEVGFHEMKASKLELSYCELLGALRMERFRGDSLLVRSTSLISVSAPVIEVGSIEFDGCSIERSLDLASCRADRLAAPGLQLGAAFLARGRYTEIDLSGATVADTANCSAIQCKGKASFRQTHWTGRADFSNAKFEGEVSFAGAVFETGASFRRSRWPGSSAVAGAFMDAVVHRLADFGGPSPPSPAAFDGCSLRAGIALDRTAHADDALFTAALQDQSSAGSLEPLENGCRVLKLAAEAARDRVSEHRFHRYELICRRRNATTPTSERFFSGLYSFAAEYGYSLTRPLANLGILWLVMTIVFALWAAGTEASLAEHLAQAAEFAARNIFNPFGVWPRPSEAPRCSANELETILAWCNGAGVRLLFRLVSTAQGIAAATLIFLAGLAIKRRFQIA